LNNLLFFHNFHIFHYSAYFLLYFPYLFTIQLTFLPHLKSFHYST
jgi:hypothetical protein